MKNNKVLIKMLSTILLCNVLLFGCANEKNILQSARESEQNVQQFSEEQTVPQSEHSTQEENHENGILQSFEAETLDGEAFTQDDFAEKDVTIINFWATFCGPCLAEMQDIAEIEKSLPDNVQLITVCLDYVNDTEVVESILNDAGYKGITLLSGTGDFETVCGEILYIPTTILVDRNGNMLGDAIVGGQVDLAETYRTAVNDALLSMGKAELGNEKN